MRKFVYSIALLACVLAVSCKKETETIVVRSHVRAHVMMSFGFNNLSYSLAEDISDLEKGYIPGTGLDDNYLFVFSHLTKGNYSTPTSPCLQRLSKNAEGLIQKDTILVMEPGTLSSGGDCIRSVLEFLKGKYPEIESYGILVSTHGTGWAPPGYCTSGYKTDGNGSDGDIEWRKQTMPQPYLSGEYLYEPTPDVKSIGYTVTSVNPTVAYETDIREFADCIPFKLDYVIFDACFMGGIEVAYQLKDKCDWLCFSQTEILSDGMDYTTMIADLLKGDRADLTSLATNYYNHYDKATGSKRSATISVVDCSRLDALAAVCRPLFRKYALDKSAVNQELLQKYYHYANHAWFYDLYSIAEAAGFSDEELLDLKWALDGCVVYKAATPTFALYGFPIRVHSGLSMYLPQSERINLNSYYTSLDWNKVTGLVRTE